jgi:hypothetical protein
MYFLERRRGVTHIRRRILRIKPSIRNDNDNEKPISLVVDASGLTVSIMDEIPKVTIGTTTVLKFSFKEFLASYRGSYHACAKCNIDM